MLANGYFLFYTYNIIVPVLKFYDESDASDTFLGTTVLITGARFF